MAIARDWLKSLWKTSYKGAPFWVETDSENGSRRIVIHEFPMRDYPYLEDLGEGKREFTVMAYVASDHADSESKTLMAQCATRGTGIMVLPTAGPVLVRCLEFTRKFEKDRLGYLAHELKFVREGFGSALASVNSLANDVFVAAEAAAVSVAAAFAAMGAVKNVPERVTDVLQHGTETALATLEAVRTSVNVEPVASAAQRDAIERTYALVPTAIDHAAKLGDIATAVLNANATASVAAGDPVSAADATLEVVGKSVADVAVALAENMDPASALSQMGDVIAATPTTASVDPLSTSVWRAAEATNQLAAYTLLRVAALTAYCESVTRVALKDRPAAITLRANVSVFFEEQLGALPSEQYDLYRAMLKLRDATIDYLSRAIIDLAPVVRVSANMQMPSLYWAWRLYGDSTRSQELADRNKVAHPSFMPVKFEALGK